MKAMLFRPRWAAAAALLGALAPAWGQFKCIGADGSVSFQQQACAGAAQQSRLEIRAVPPSAERPTPAPEIARAEAMGRERRVRELQYEIRDLEAAIERRGQAMDRELNRLKRQQRQTANNLAGATLRNSLSADMQAVTAKAQALNEVDLARLQLLRNELGAAQAAVR